MKLLKRGISPLIATVLIVGFTIALAAIIISWGQTFTRQIQQDTETWANEQIVCVTEVVFDVSNACDNGTNSVKVTVKNDGSKGIDSFLARSYRAPDDVEQDTLTFATGGNGLAAFDIENNVITVTSEPITLVELIPVVTIEGKSVTCAQNIQKFIQVSGSAEHCTPVVGRSPYAIKAQLLKATLQVVTALHSLVKLLSFRAHEPGSAAGHNDVRM